MTTKPFTFDDCKPHRDGKRRALMRNGSVCDLLSNQASGDPSIVVEFEGNLSRRFSNGRLFEHQISYRDLVGPAPEQPRRWWVNRYALGLSSVYESKEEAEKYQVCRIECICVEEVQP